METGSIPRFEELDRQLLPGFERRSIDVGEGPVRVLIAGNGPPLLMLHGDPQTHLCWHHIAPSLAQRFTVVLTDLRGRGESHKPGLSKDSTAYSKREMAAEQAAVMSALGFDTFSLVGHDRGGRVARRLALDFPEKVLKLAILDIIPALDFYEAAQADIAQDYYYFFFLTQPSPVPERLISGDPSGFMDEILNGLSKQPVPYEKDALELYIANAATPEAVTAMCECFRAGIGLDSSHDREDRAAGRHIECPTLILWGENGVVGRHFDVRSIWRRWAPDAEFAPMPCGHFIPEEAPNEVTRALEDFL